MTRTRLITSLLVIGTLAGAACSSDGDSTTDSTDSTTGTTVVGADDSEPVGTAEGSVEDTANPDNSADIPDAASDATSDAVLEVAIEPTPYSPIAALATIVTDSPTKVSIVATAGDHVVEVPTTAIATTEHAIPIVGMRQSLDYELTINILDESDEVVETLADPFSTGAIDRELPDFEFVVDTDKSGSIGSMI